MVVAVSVVHQLGGAQSGGLNGSFSKVTIRQTLFVFILPNIINYNILKTSVHARFQLRAHLSPHFSQSLSPYQEKLLVVHSISSGPGPTLVTLKGCGLDWRLLKATSISSCFGYLA